MARFVLSGRQLWVFIGVIYFIALLLVSWYRLFIALDFQ